MAAGDPVTLRAPRAGYLVAVDGERLVRAAADRDAFVAQRLALGDFVVRGATVAELWSASHHDAAQQDAVDDLGACFSYANERNPVQDFAFPVRQLADVALRGLSPSLNDPTTAEDALGSLAQLLISYAEADHPDPLRTDADGAPRLLACAPSLDDLVRLAFDQVRIAAAPHPTVAARILWLLAEIRRTAARCGCSASEIDRQVDLLRQGVLDEVPTSADEKVVEHATQAVRAQTGGGRAANAPDKAR